MIYRKSIYLTFAAAMMILMIACSHPPGPAGEMTWPPPPAEPQVMYVKSIHSNNDIRRSFLGKIKDFLFGRSAGWNIGKPYGVAYDGRSRLYIVDTAKKGVIVFDLSSGTAEFFNSLGNKKTLKEPVYLILDKANNIYVSDTEIKKVAVFTPDFKFSHFIGSDEDFESPVGMAFGRNEDKLYVVDTKNHKIKIFNREGRFIGEIGRRGDEQGEFYYPLTVVVDSKGNVFIVDSFHFAVQSFDSAGNYRFSFGPKKIGMGSLARPRDIAIDADNNLYITDALRNNVQVFSSNGEFLFSFGQTGLSSGEFRLPAGIFIDNNNMIYIADSINRRVQIFKYLGQR